MQNRDQISVRFIEVGSHKSDSPILVEKSQQKIYIRAVKGVVENFRRGFGGLFLAVFFLIPWLTYDGKQAVLFDFVTQRFHLFGSTLWPQDLTLLM